ncbi:unnamed protein product, partial [Allacma fusca]
MKTVTLTLEDLWVFIIRAVEFFIAAVLLILVILIFHKLRQYFNFVKANCSPAISSLSQIHP